MRPTNLGFRSPKERTGDMGYPKVTHDGRSLPYLQVALSSSLPKSKRFTQYDQAARRTSTRVGPGAYNTQKDPKNDWNIAGTPIIRPLCGTQDTSNGYFFIGQQIVFDASFVKKAKKSSFFPSFKPIRLSTSSVPRRESFEKPSLLTTSHHN